ncbi:hypothetical protein M8J75_003219 [Diaphorina citri]|nr:hypothetical protein M8J75_003219 [Diaphorina citri]
MEPEMNLAIQQIMELIEGKKTILKEKTFSNKDTGDVYPKEAVHKIIEILNMAIQKLSHTLTKMTILLSERPLPKNEDLIPLYSELCLEINQFCEIFTTMYPIHCGVLLKQTYKQACIDILESIGEVLNEICTDVYNKEKLLLANGCVWESCRKYQALPRDMIQLCLAKCQTEYDALVDAEEELKNEIKEHQESDFSFDESSWTEDDLKLLTPACGLIKTTYSICKKLKESIHRSGHLDTKERVDQIDQTAMAVQTLSPSIDDLVTSLYPPLVKKQVYTSTKALLSALDSILSMLPSVHFILETDTWIAFLQKASEHNSTKLLNNLAYDTDVTSQMEELNIT